MKIYLFMTLLCSVTLLLPCHLSVRGADEQDNDATLTELEEPFINPMIACCFIRPYLWTNDGYINSYYHNPFTWGDKIPKAIRITHKYPDPFQNLQIDASLGFEFTSINDKIITSLKDTSNQTLATYVRDSCTRKLLEYRQFRQGLQTDDIQWKYENGRLIELVMEQIPSDVNPATYEKHKNSPFSKLRSRLVYDNSGMVAEIRILYASQEWEPIGARSYIQQNGILTIAQKEYGHDRYRIICHGGSHIPRQIFTIDPDNHQERLTHEYNERGDLACISYIDWSHNPPTITETWTFTFDKSGYLHKVLRAGSFQAEFEYDNNQAVRGVEYNIHSDGSLEKIKDIEFEY